MAGLVSMIDFRIMAAAFVVGLLFVWISNPPRERVPVYPTPENAGQVVYADKAGLCYAYEPKPVECPKEGGKRIPIQ
jgi:hypothetical protein